MSEVAGRSPDLDRSHMVEAIKLARESKYVPPVGIVIARGTKVYVTGYKGEGDAGEHAEQVAMRKARERGCNLRGTTAYVTLEPCVQRANGGSGCAELLKEAGVRHVYIGRNDRNPDVTELGRLRLRELGLTVHDFDGDLRDEIDRTLLHDWDTHFTRCSGMRGGARFDFTQNGGCMEFVAPDLPGSPVWLTQWSTCGSDSIYAYGGVVGHPRHVTSFGNIDDPGGSCGFAGTAVKIPVEEIAIFKNDHGYVLVRIRDLNPTADYGGTGNPWVEIEWQIRPASDPRRVAGEP